MSPLGSVLGPKACKEAGREDGWIDHRQTQSTQSDLLIRVKRPFSRTSKDRSRIHRASSFSKSVVSSAGALVRVLADKIDSSSGTSFSRLVGQFFRQPAPGVTVLLEGVGRLLLGRYLLLERTLCASL